MKCTQTNRLAIRRFKSSDLSSLRELMTNPKVMQFTGFQTPQSEEKIKSCLGKWVADSEGPLGVWAVESNQTQEFIGWVMLNHTGREDPELGFMLSERHWHKGYATEICEAMVHYGFSQLNLKRIVATVNTSNKASIKVLTKIGMTPTQQGMKNDHPNLEIFELRRRSLEQFGTHVPIVP